jgi:prepilin-type N-terminal cleavage/methylation domain-containing protein/prepilin-type processing-associated H-X9-DG protein
MGGVERRPVMVSKGNRGFTLIELLVVIAIIGILAALLLPALNAVRRNAKKTDCLNNLNGIGKAIMIYEDRNKAYPDGTSTTFLDNLRAGAGGAVQDAQFVCKLTGNTAGPGITDYRGPAQRVTDQFPASTAIVGDRTSCHGSKEDINVLYFDGHVEKAPFDSALWRDADLKLQ